MARGLRDIRRKMKAIKSTRQVTKAMELVSASKMRKAVQQTLELRRFAAASLEVLQRVAGHNPQLHPTLSERPARKVLAIVYSSDRGLAGSLNAQLFRAVAQYVRGVKEMQSFQSLEFIAIGRKGQQYLARTGQQVIAAFPAFSGQPSFRDLSPVMKLASRGFAEGTYDHVVLIYTDFVSALVQEPVVKVLLPFSQSQLQEMIDTFLPRKRGQAAKTEAHGTEYLFEPSPQQVIDTIIPQITNLQMYQALLEAVASEHSARMVAMRAATDNASSLLDDLTLTYNQTRQGMITQELAELSASKAALE